VAAGLVSQGLAIFDSLRGGIAQAADEVEEPPFIGKAELGTTA
jgi:hypothetical protein